MEQEIVRADREYRKKFIGRFIVLYLGCFLIGAALILWVFPWLQDKFGRLDGKTAFLVIKAAIIFVFMSMLPIAIYLLRFGQRIIESEQLPPPDTKVIRDTHVIRGDAAVARGRTVVFLSVLMMCVSLMGAFYIPHKMDKIMEKRAGPNSTVEAVGRHCVVKA
jgi:MFS family permease